MVRGKRMERTTVRASSRFVGLRASVRGADHCRTCREWPSWETAHQLRVIDQAGERYECPCGCHVSYRGRMGKKIPRYEPELEVIW